MSLQQLFSKQSAFSNFDFISKQMQVLSNTIFATIDIKINGHENELRQLLKTTIQSLINSRLSAEQSLTNQNAKRIIKD